MRASCLNDAPDLPEHGYLPFNSVMPVLDEVLEEMIQAGMLRTRMTTHANGRVFMQANVETKMVVAQTSGAMNDDGTVGFTAAVGFWWLGVFLVLEERLGDWLANFEYDNLDVYFPVTLVWAAGTYFLMRRRRAELKGWVAGVGICLAIAGIFVWLLSNCRWAI